jgi:hypothetical protein
VECPANIDAQWTGKAELQAVGDGPRVVMHVFGRTNCAKKCGSLQLVQVVYSTPSPDVPMTEINDWSACVDAGLKSVWHRGEGGVPADPSRSSHIFNQPNCAFATTIRPAFIVAKLPMRAWKGMAAGIVVVNRHESGIHRPDANNQASSERPRKSHLEGCSEFSVDGRASLL